MPLTLILFLLRGVPAGEFQFYLDGGSTALHARPLALPILKKEEAKQSGEGVGSPKLQEPAREPLMTAQPLSPQDAIVLYQLSVAAFNSGNTTEARLRLRQAHALLQFREEGTEKTSVAELQMVGAYHFIPVWKDRWHLRAKSEQMRVYHLDVGSLYQMELEHEKPSRSKSLASIPIGLFLAWTFAR
ncbi:hypothetical protein HYR99_19910 [Candidatus Poribacteria bacterium]|nr:hypothetical protein [Candidatus Poribacteria bacterium]